jgi:hypothetical protein
VLKACEPQNNKYLVKKLRHGASQKIHLGDFSPIAVLADYDILICMFWTFEFFRRIEPGCFVAASAKQCRSTYVPTRNRTRFVIVKNPQWDLRPRSTSIGSKKDLQVLFMT